MGQIKKEKELGGLNFEQAIDELSGIVESIESGQTPLQSSIDQYEKGMELIKHCREILQTAEKKIEKIAQEKNKE
jgi:exodeoxyribonuclease VII small subunit